MTFKIVVFAGSVLLGGVIYNKVIAPIEKNRRHGEATNYYAHLRDLAK